MMFRRIMKSKTGMVAAMVAMPLLCMLPGVASAAGEFAVVTTEIVYPGEELLARQLEEVPVTNPNLNGGYARSISEVVGMISKRTLLPGRTIPVAGLREPFAVKRGAGLRLIFNIGNMVISAAGSPLQDAAVGDVIRVRNLDSGIIVNGTVMANGTVQVMAK
ncbi:MAG: flagellar basal body P-ring formation chaperone FlgA [Allorhizobium sp.]